MFVIWLLEAGKGILSLLIHPLFYLFILTALLIGLKRVRREREQFNTSIYDFLTELRALFYPGIVTGLLLSVVTIGLGLVVPIGMIILLAASTALFLCFGSMRLLSPVYPIGLTILIALFAPAFSIKNEMVQRWIQDIQNTPLIVLGIILIMLLIVEGLFIRVKGTDRTSPITLKSKRGKSVGLHEANRLWMIPMFLVIPGETLTSSFPWWPLFGIGGQTFGLLVVPFGIGFFQQVQSMLPKEAIALTGKRVLQLSFIVLLVSIAGYWEPFVVVVAAVLAIIGREWITYKQQMFYSENASYFSVRQQGIVILGVIPRSPADKMGLSVGEVIMKVNGKKIRTENEFYVALQENRAFCKLEVLDINHEIRFAQRALYDGENHKLGILFVKEESDEKNQAV